MPLAGELLCLGLCQPIGYHHAMTYDTRRLAQLGARHQDARAAYESAKAEMLPEVEAAIRANVRQVDIVKMTGLTRERIRQIERSLGSHSTE